MKYHLVIARYKETIDWLNNVPNDWEIIIYNKYEGDNLLPNVGRESHTYLYHIIKNYNNLPDEIMFCQAKPHIDYKWLDQWFNDHNFKNIRTKKPKRNNFPKSISWGTLKNVELDANRCWKNLFGTEYHGNPIDMFYNGLFKVKKEAILKYPKSFYENAIKMVDYCADPVEGHFFERIWLELFREKVIQLRPKSDGLNDLIKQIEKDIPNGDMVEIGSYQGESTELFAKSQFINKIYSIDPYISNYDERDPVSSSSLIEAEKIFLERISKYPDKVIKIKTTSEIAVKSFSKNSINFIYIDGCHTYESTKRDLEIWYPIIIKGGYLGGHDYVNKGYLLSVTKAVNEFILTHNLNLSFKFSDSSFLIKV